MTQKMIFQRMMWTSVMDRRKLDFKIEGYYFNKIFVEALESIPDGFDGEVQAKQNINATELNDDNIMFVNLHIICDPEVCTQSPYTIDIVVTAKVIYFPKEEDDLQNNGVDIATALTRNAASICYAATREKVLSLTARSVWGEVMLPPNYFASLRKKVDPNNSE